MCLIEFAHKREEGKNRPTYPVVVPTIVPSNLPLPLPLFFPPSPADLFLLLVLLLLLLLRRSYPLTALTNP